MKWCIKFPFNDDNYDKRGVESSTETPGMENSVKDRANCPRLPDEKIFRCSNQSPIEWPNGRAHQYDKWCNDSTPEERKYDWLGKKQKLDFQALKNKIKSELFFFLNITYLHVDTAIKDWWEFHFHASMRTSSIDAAFTAYI